MASRNIFKSLLHGLFIFLLSTTVFFGITLTSLALTVTDREVIKSWPVEAGVYDDVTANILDLAAHQQSEGGEEGGGGDELSQLLNSETLDSNKIKSAIGSVYTPRYWQTQFETVVDSTFEWLDGNQPQLEFEIDFGDKIDAVAGAVSTEVANQLAGLSTCKTYQLPRQFDVLSAECLPPGVSATQAASQLEKSLKSENGLGGQDLRLSTDKWDITPEAEQNFQRGFNAASQAPVIFVVVALILIGLVTITGRTWLYGLRRSGLVLISAGILSWIGFFLLKQLGNITPEINDEAAKEVVENILTPVLRTMIASFANVGLWVALSAIITGILLWLGAYTWHKVHHHSEAEKIAERAMGSQTKNTTLPPPIDPKKS